MGQKVGLEIKDIFLGIELTVLGKERLKENLEGQKGQYSGLLRGWWVDGVDLPTKK